MKLSPITSEQYFVITKVISLSFLKHCVEHIRPKHWGISKQKSDIPFGSYRKGVCVSVALHCSYHLSDIFLYLLVIWNHSCQARPHKLFWGWFSRCVGRLHLRLYLLYYKNIDPVNRPLVRQHTKLTFRHKRRLVSGYYINHCMKSSSYTREKYCGNVPCYSISVWAECGTAGSAGVRKEKRSWTASDTARSPDLDTVLSCLLVLWYISVFVEAFSQHTAFKDKVWRVLLLSRIAVCQPLPGARCRAGGCYLRHSAKLLPCSLRESLASTGGLVRQHTFTLKCEVLQ